MATIRAVYYREKASALHEAAASASSDGLRQQLTTLARQYEHLAASVENMNHLGDPNADD